MDPRSGAGRNPARSVSCAAGVERALQVLGRGFTSHPRNAALRDALRSGDLKPAGPSIASFSASFTASSFSSSPRIAPSTGESLLHPRDDSGDGRAAREVYASHYGTARLRALAGRIRGSRHGDLWQQFRLVAGALSGEPDGESVRRHLALPALGSFLWSAESTPDLNDSELTNHDFLEALRHLAFTRQQKILRPVDYRNLGAEELGGVYESLLALTPQVSGDGADFTFAEFAGNARKTSGSFYTPDVLVQSLLDTALDPVVEAALRDKTGEEGRASDSRPQGLRSGGRLRPLPRRRGASPCPAPCPGPRAHGGRERAFAAPLPARPARRHRAGASTAWTSTPCRPSSAA